jgi:two-component system, LytTR family, sensor kinase
MNKIKFNRLFWIVNFIAWFLYSLFFMFLKKGNRENFLDFYLWAITYIIGFIVTVILRYFYRYLSKKYPSISFIAVLILFGSIIGSIVWKFTDFSLSVPFFEDKSDGFVMYESLRHFIKNHLFLFFIILSWSALYFGIKFFIDYQSEKKQKEEALVLAQRAELEMLRYQLNPHFLFNALNSVRGLIDENKVNAKEMITELSEFLRYTLIHKNIAFVPLSNELEAIKHYLSIEKKRFEEKLQIDYNISEEASKQSILSLLLHPLVENAVKHGMKNSPLPLKISIDALFENEELTIQVCNTGKWIDRSIESDSTGTGLNNVKRRLENAYGKNFSFEIPKQENNVCVKIKIYKSSNDENSKT